MVLLYSQHLGSLGQHTGHFPPTVSASSVSPCGCFLKASHVLSRCRLPKSLAGPLSLYLTVWMYWRRGEWMAKEEVKSTHLRGSSERGAAWREALSAAAAAGFYRTHWAATAAAAGHFRERRRGECRRAAVRPPTLPITATRDFFSPFNPHATTLIRLLRKRIRATIREKKNGYRLFPVPILRIKLKCQNKVDISRFCGPNPLS